MAQGSADNKICYLAGPPGPVKRTNMRVCWPARGSAKTQNVLFGRPVGAGQMTRYAQHLRKTRNSKAGLPGPATKTKYAIWPAPLGASRMTRNDCAPASRLACARLGFPTKHVFVRPRLQSKLLCFGRAQTHFLTLCHKACFGRGHSPEHLPSIPKNIPQHICFKGTKIKQ